MELILAGSDGRQIEEIRNYSMDMELNDGDRDFELSIPYQDWKENYTFGNRIFVPGTEYGGLIGELYTDTASGKIALLGKTWRGILEDKILCPPDGSDYLTVSGELNTVIGSLIAGKFGDVIKASTDLTGVSVTWKFDRFCTLRAGIEKMLKSVGYKLSIRYMAGTPNGTGYVQIGAAPIVNYSDQIELSQDSQLQFVMDEKKNGVNHLIVGGKGDLQERNVIHLYVQSDGSIGKTPYYTGVEEIEQFYENTSTETEALETAGIEKLESLMNKKSFQMDVGALGLEEVEIGDIIGGRDYITGMSMEKPVKNIVITMADGKIVKDYKLEGTG